MFRHLLNGYSRKVFFEQIMFKFDPNIKIFFTSSRRTLQYSKIFNKRIVSTSVFLKRKNAINSLNDILIRFFFHTVKSIPVNQFANNLYHTYRNNVYDTSLYKSLMIVLGGFPNIFKKYDIDVAAMYSK